MLNQLKHLLSFSRSQTNVTVPNQHHEAASENSTYSNPMQTDPTPDPTLKDAYLSGWFQHDTRELVKGFSIDPEHTVLDIGCGDGTFIQFCANQGASVIFADIDADKIDMVTQRLKNSPAKSVHPLITDGNPIPLADGIADRVIAMEVLEHVDDPSQFMNELARVAKPGAQLLLTVPAAQSENLQKDLAPDSYFQKPNHIRIFNQDAFEKLVTDAGLIIERQFSYGFYWTLWWCFFWTCKQDLAQINHPLLQNWARTWDAMLETTDGIRIKKALDDALPKSQAIIARKPS